jgi:hypothetical protein
MPVSLVAQHALVYQRLLAGYVCIDVVRLHISLPYYGGWHVWPHGLIRRYAVLPLSLCLGS